MPLLVLYAAVVLIWGSTWFVITFQLGPVAEELSVGYRFGLASLFLFAYARATGQSLRIKLDYYLIVVLMGVLMFSISYVMVYIGSRYITTGLVAVLYSLIILFNGALERLIYGTPIDGRLVAAAMTGLLGTALVFWPEVSSLTLEDRAVLGIGWTVLSVFIASLGNMAAITNTRRALPIVTVNAHAMAWGAASCFLIATLFEREWRFSMTADYVLSLVYLALFGSCVAFGCFLALIKRIGSARASYASVLFPVVALAISTVFEDYRWSLPAAVGVAFILSGNWLALSRVPQRPQTSTSKS